MKKYKRPTRADVARLAGVSETVVSYVVNNNRYVSKDKRKRVEEAIKELNYLPNNIARTLKGKKSNHIVFIADQIANEHFSHLVSEMEKYAYDKGYMISLCANRNSDEFFQQILSRQYDGIIISSISFPEQYIKRFADLKIPVVVLYNRKYKKIDNVGIINTGLYSGAKEIIQHLASRGRKNIIYIDRFSSRGNFSTMSDLRLRGFVEEMHSQNLEVSENSIITGCKDEEEVSVAIKSYLENGNPVDAIFARNDNLACITMKTIQDMGYLVPKDIAVVGFDNSSLSRYVNPTLTTVEMQRGQIGKAAFDMLYQMIEEGEVPQPVTFGAKLLVRNSS